MTDKSMFGAGVVVCLVKFHEHFSNRDAELLQSAFQWQRLDPIEREHILQDPQGNPGWDTLTAVLSLGQNSIDDLIGIWGRSWVEGASNHLLDLDLERAPEPLVYLREEMMEISRDGDPFTEDKYLLFYSLVQDASIMIDISLGCTPDWGDV